MFSQAITTTPLTTEIANNVFGDNISGGAYAGDVSFLATMRALIYPRMGEYDEVAVFFSSTSYSAGTIERHAATDLYNGMCVHSGGTGIVNIHSFDSYEDIDNEKNMDFVEKTFLETYPEWYRIEKVTDFYIKFFKVLCFVNPETKSVCIFSSKLDMKMLHYLQCGILAYMPWYFNKEDGVTELEMELIESLRMKTPQKYIECLQKIADQYDFNTEFIKSKLADFEIKWEREAIESTKNDIRSIISEINALSERIAMTINTKRDLETKILGLEARIREEEQNGSEVMDYFLHNKSLTLLEVSGSTIKFAVKGYLDSYDIEAAENIIENKKSYVYNPDGSDGDSLIPVGDMEKLMKAIFIDQKLKVKFCAVYRIAMRGEGVRAVSHYSYDHRFSDAMPNPHIDEHSCLGNYTQYINEYVGRNDCIGAIEQCVASCKSLNLTELPTSEIFIGTIYGLKTGRDRVKRNNKCIELPDGRVVNPKEAIEYLKGEGGNEQGN